MLVSIVPVLIWVCLIILEPDHLRELHHKPLLPHSPDIHGDVRNHDIYGYGRVILETDYKSFHLRQFFRHLHCNLLLLEQLRMCLRTYLIALHLESIVFNLDICENFAAHRHIFLLGLRKILCMKFSTDLSFGDNLYRTGIRRHISVFIDFTDLYSFQLDLAGERSLCEIHP